MSPLFLKTCYLYTSRLIIMHYDCLCTLVSRSPVCSLFVSDSKKMPTEFEEIIAGRVSFIEILLDYQTLTEDAVNSRLLLSLPPRLLGAPQSIRDTTGNVRLCMYLWQQYLYLWQCKIITFPLGNVRLSLYIW